MLNSWVRGNVATLDALLHFGIRRVVAGDGEPMQDHDRNRSVDKGGESRGVFACQQRPGGSCRSVGQNEPVGRRRDALELLGANRPHNLRQADHTGKTGSEPPEQLRNHCVTSFPRSNVTLCPSSSVELPSGFPDAGAAGPRQGRVNWQVPQARQRSTSSG